MCAQLDNRIVDMLTNGEWELLVFRRSLSREEIRQWEELLEELSEHEVDEEVRDEVIWALDCWKTYSLQVVMRTCDG